MTPALPSHSSWVDATSDLAEVAALAGAAVSMDQLVARALEALESVIPHDMAALLELDGDDLCVKVARGPLTTPEVLHHRLRLSDYPTLRQVLADRRARALDEHEHAEGDGDPYDGVLDLPHGHSCMVVPLFAGERTYGVLTFDSRVCGLYRPEQVNLAGIYGQIIGLAMFAAEQAAIADAYRQRAEEHARFLIAEREPPASPELMRTQSPAMRALIGAARRVAATPAPVLILGETGTGKEVLARAIHDWSPRHGGAFVSVNCGALPANLIESELFGHVRGAFSGAVKDRPGRFAIANGGTILLDEVGDMPLDVQVKILRVLQESEIQPVGSDKAVRIDVRVLAATHVDLESAVETGSFREDLYYRLNVFPLHVPPLRERLEDLEELALDILGHIHRRTRRGPWHLSRASLARMRQYGWPGNVRELVNLLERSTILATGSELDVELPERRPRRLAEGYDSDSELPSLQENERRYLERLLAKTGGRIYGEDGAAEIAGLPPSTLQSRMAKLGLRRTAVAQRSGGS